MSYNNFTDDTFDYAHSGILVMKTVDDILYMLGEREFTFEAADKLLELLKIYIDDDREQVEYQDLAHYLKKEKVCNADKMTVKKRKQWYVDDPND